MELDFLRCGRYFQSILGESQKDIKTAVLGKEPHYAPDRSFDTVHVDLNLSVDFQKLEVAGTCTTRVQAYRDGVGIIELDARDMRILAASVDGIRATFKHDGKILRITLPRALAGKHQAEVAVRYRLRDPKVGLHFVLDPRTKKAVQLWSQGQPEESKYWFPCHDAPHEKATNSITVTVPEGWTSVSNGILEERIRGARRGTVVFRWRMDHPHSLYLITLAVGRFGVVNDRWKHVPLSYYCDKGREDDVRRGLGKTPKAMEYFSSHIGVPYPYEQYSQVVVSEYPGGMENTTATTMTDACLIDKRAALDNDVDALMAHELAHQWFGDLLTCRDWSHAWLNEGFATYFEGLFTLHDKGQDEFDYELFHNKRWYMHEDEKRYRRPIVSQNYKNPSVLFDRHLYEKGAWVLHMLRRELGDELFWKSVGHYVRKHRYQSVETSDLIAAIEDATGRNLKWFFDQWVYRAGYPSLKAAYRWDPKAKKAAISISQTQSISDEQPAFKLDVDLHFAGRGWTKSFSKKLSKKEDEWEFKLPSEPLTVEIDPDYWILKKLAFKKPHALWVNQLRVRRAIGRIAAAHEVAHWGDSAAVAALASALAREKFWGAAAEMAQALGSIRTPEALRALQKFAGHRHPKVRRAVIEALAEFKNAATAAVVRRLARRDPSILVEGAAVRSLAALRDPKYLVDIRAKSRAASYRDVLSAASAQGLAASRNPKVLPLLRQMTRHPFGAGARMAAIRAIGSFYSVTPEVIDWLAEHLYDRDMRVVLAAVQSLGQTEDIRACAPLEKLKKTARESHVIVAVDEALAAIPSKKK